MDEEITEATLVADEETGLESPEHTPAASEKVDEVEQEGDKGEPSEEEHEEKARDEKIPRSQAAQKRELTLTHLIVAVIVAIIIVGGTGAYLMQSGGRDVVVNVPDMRIGDEARYTVSGNIDVRGAENDPIGDEISSASINLQGSTMTVGVDGIETVTDGFYHNYSALKTSTDLSYSLKGWAQTESYQKVDITGTAQLSERAYRNGNTILLSDITGNSHIHASAPSTGFSKDYDSTDHLRTYSSNDAQGKMDEIIHLKDLKKGMKGDFTVGETTYHYEATGNAHIFDTDCVVVEFRVVEPMPENLTKQSLRVYLSSKYPFPVRTELEVVTTVQGTITVKTIMTMNHFTPGTQPVVIPNDTINRTSPYFEGGKMGIYPPEGTPANTSIGDFNITKAHDKAVKDSGLGDYLKAHTNAFLVQGIYNDTNGPHWNLTYSYPGANKGYRVIVKEGSVDDHGEMPLSGGGTGLKADVQVPVNVLTWAGAEQILKHDSVVKEKAFSGDKLNSGECNFGVRTALYQPSVDPVSMFASAPQVNYGYTLIKGDELTAGVDAGDGQLLFVAIHSGVKLL